MTANAQRKAEQCFALAQSTNFDGERSAAISRGLAICRRHGLDPDSFDIPGRPHIRPAASPRVTMTYVELDGSGLSPGELRDALDEILATVAGEAAFVGVRPGETFHEARRRNFDVACALASAIDALRTAGHLVRKTPSGWVIRGPATSDEMERLDSDQALIDRAAAIRRYV